MDNTFKAWEMQIKRKENLTDLGRNLETMINKGVPEAERGFCYYLYGYIFYQMGLADRAIRFLEEAAQAERSLTQAHFLLYRIYRQHKNYLKAANCLEACLHFDYQTPFCRRMLIKLSYRAKDYPAVLNYLTEFEDVLSLKPFWRTMRIKCLQWLNLHDEASLAYQELLKNKVPLRIQKWLGDIGTAEITSFEKTYLENQSFFQHHGIVTPDFAGIRFKVCRFLDNQLVYDCENKRFIVSLNDGEPDFSGLSIAADDSVIIYNTDNVSIFKYLQKMLSDVDSPVYRKRIGAIPVLTIEHQTDNWHLVMQLFDFNSLEEWHNLHFYIGINDEDLGALLLDEYLALPNVLYGTNLDSLNQVLAHVHAAKEASYQRHLESLVEYYQDKQGPLDKILIITSIYNESLSYYGKLLQDYFVSQDTECRLYCETAPFYKFSKYSDARLMDEFRPDLVINLFAVKEELEVFRELNLPFISWMMFHKQIATEKNPDRKQFFLLAGNDSLVNDLKVQGYLPEQIFQSILPVSRRVHHQLEEHPEEHPFCELGIIANLENVDFIIKNLTLRLERILVTRLKVQKESLQAIFQGIYFEIYTSYISKNFSRLIPEIYEEIIKNQFGKIQINFDGYSLRVIALLVKQEFENLILKVAQTKWVMSEFGRYSISLYGEGWSIDPSCRPLDRGQVDWFNDPEGYRKVVLSNKINLYIGPYLNNNSLMQPDLIMGITAGGFYLVNNQFGKDCGAAVPERFGGLLETYQSVGELAEKIKFYLANETEREKRAREVQAYVLKNFDIAKIAKQMISIPRQATLNVLN